MKDDNWVDARFEERLDKAARELQERFSLTGDLHELDTVVARRLLVKIKNTLRKHLKP